MVHRLALAGFKQFKRRRNAMALGREDDAVYAFCRSVFAGWRRRIKQRSLAEIRERGAHVVGHGVGRAQVDASGGERVGNAEEIGLDGDAVLGEEQV